MPSKQDRKARPGPVQCHWCCQLFDDTCKRDYHQEICEFYGSSTTPRAQDIGMPQGYITFRTFCNENRILSKKYRDAFLAYVKKGRPDLLKFTEECLDTAFKEYKGGSQTIVGQYGINVLPQEFVRHNVEDANDEDE